MDSIIFDKNDAIDRVDGDIDFLAELTKDFLAAFPAKFEELQEAAKNNYNQKVEKRAHSLKGALRNLGGIKSGDIAAALELAGKNMDIHSINALLSEFDKSVQEFEREFNVFLESSQTITSSNQTR